MPVLVQKFGGTSVATVEKIRAAALRAVEAKRQGYQVVTVVSARGKKTDELVELAHAVSSDPPPREMDMLLSTGEQESVALVAMAIHELGEPATSLTGAQIGIITDSAFTKARIKRISTDRIRRLLSAGHIVVAAGFQGVDEDFNITTLGRGGSDTTATALAAVLQAERCDIYTDVEGVFTADPRFVKQARKIPRISYDEMLELASLGAGVMHSRSIEFAKKYNVPLCVRPSYCEGEGTVIGPETDGPQPVVTGMAFVRNEARVTLGGLPDRPGILRCIFDHMARRKIAIDMVVQDVATDNRAEISFTVPEPELAGALSAAHAAVAEIGCGCVREGTDVSKVSVVGSGMRTHTGVAAQMFRALAEAGANIELITTSDIKISTLIGREHLDAALEAVHTAFELHRDQPAPPPVGIRHAAAAAASAATGNLERDVVDKLAHMEDIVVSEVEFDAAQSRIHVTNLPDVHGMAAHVFGAVADGGIMVDLIVQNIGANGRANLSFTVPAADVDSCLLLVRAALDDHPDVRIAHERQIAKLSVLGIGLRSHTGVGQTMFAALAEAGINVQMVSTSEIKMSVVVAAEQGEAAHRCLLQAFGLSESQSS
ncbi:MAG: aspartate kinase [Planctomycetota bacterium]|nr:MAG: aspartate kinase [Planctomycetota bacterium]